ncbi:divalent-cation tolerance protein CutA [bacterium]|nr:divalent-cation tolerance protein CutA [bacterium]
MEPSARKDKIINHIKVFGRITSSEVQSLLDVHRNTALKDLKRLLHENVIQSFGRGKGTFYQLIDQIIFEPQLIQELFTGKQKINLENYFKQAKRKSVFFDKIQNQALTAKSEFCQVIISATNKEEANNISDNLVKNKLIAGSLIVKGPSRYWWKNEIVEKEYHNIQAFSLFTKKDKIILEVKKIHSDECPIIAFLAMDGNLEFLDWIKESVS